MIILWWSRSREKGIPFIPHPPIQHLYFLSRHDLLVSAFSCSRACTPLPVCGSSISNVLAQSCRNKGLGIICLHPSSSGRLGRLDDRHSLSSLRREASEANFGFGVGRITRGYFSSYLPETPPSLIVRSTATFGNDQPLTMKLVELRGLERFLNKMMCPE
ncbi:hypothetical protein BO82DRAFT_214282 [Aspergillus uvarum CBS 121591]|uniref:Uncharacterized protein n=1 Tax=Aspergillus uvarum CBS 121591 TaxID=1448315 RepID=A0A319D8B0_9EURO|nr:hypothetical protein BO82DRAFT_214282 [Aspergillus uvarum CBS 121591]PYH76202.1 hypothetical protein BO82DRAFT_214282 [Aspergillus uvarum CBS 121591]